MVKVTHNLSYSYLPLIYLYYSLEEVKSVEQNDFGCRLCSIMKNCGLPENCGQILGSCSRIPENCSKIPEICNITEVCEVRKNCTQIVENCNFRQICNLTVNFFSSSGDQYATRVILLVSAVILFIFLLLKDGVKGLKIRAQWIPGDFLVLSALTIELLNLISTQGKPLELNTGDISLNVFWMIHTSRIMLCVVVAYLMPTMANPGAEDFWGKILALAMVVFLHVLSELYIVNPEFAGLYLKSLWPKQRGTSITLYYILGALMVLSFVLLLLLLGCANIAGRGIERILAKNIPMILKEQAEKDHHNHQQQSSETVEEDHHCQECWRRVEDAVWRAWIVARAYSLEHIIARSALTASAATVVTTQITITVVAGVWNSPRMKMCNSEDRLMLAITMLQCVFILIGWTMILWRWATAVAYYGSWGSCLWMEDFWTRHLRELQEAKTTRRLRQAELLHAKIEALVTNESTIITSPRRLLYAVIWLQWLTVSFSKSCWLASQLLFRNKLTGRLLSLLLSKLKIGYSPDYERILEGVQILGETSESLWLSNRHSIRKAETIISRVREDAEKNCRVLVDFVATKKTDHGLGLSILDPYETQPRLKYLCKITPIKGTEQAQEEEFTDMSTKSWKMTAVSLLSIILQLSQICAPTQKERPSTSQLLPRGKVLKDCLDAYSRAWEIIDFVDKADAEVDEITSEAADQYFFILQAKVAAASNSSEPAHDENMAAHEKATKSKARQTPVCLNSLVSEVREKSRGCINRWSGDDSTEFKASDSVVAALAELKKECKSKTQSTVLVNVLCPKSKEKTEGKSKTHETPDNVDGRPSKRKEKGEDRNKSETAESVNVVRLRRSRWNGRDSTDWTAAAWGSAVYKLCNSIDCNEDTNVNDLLKELESCLADIIKYCLEKIQHLLFLNSRKWTVNSDERKSAKALFTTVKARMIVEMLREKIENDQGSGSAIVPYVG